MFVDGLNWTNPILLQTDLWNIYKGFIRLLLNELQEFLEKANQMGAHGVQLIFVDGLNWTNPIL